MRLLTFSASYFSLVEQSIVREVESARRDEVTREWPEMMRDRNQTGDAIVIVLHPNDSFHDAAKALYQAVAPKMAAPKRTA